MIKERAIVIFAIVAGILLVIPIIFFVVNFWGTQISERAEDWAYFGGYFGGLIGTIVSVLSLFIIGYISIWVSKQGSAENKNIYINKQRFDAYNKLTTMLPDFQKNTIIGLDEIARLNKNIDEKSIFLLTSKYPGIDLAYKSASDLFYFIVHFDSMFRVLFDYDFKSAEFKILINETGKIFHYFEKASNYIHGLDNSFESDFKKEDFFSFIRNIGNFCKRLETEIKL